LWQSFADRSYGIDDIAPGWRFTGDNGGRLAVATPMLRISSTRIHHVGDVR